MPNKKSTLPLGEYIHVRDNVYKIRSIYRGFSFNHYVIKASCTTCGETIYRDQRNVKRWAKGYCSPECKKIKMEERMEGTIKYKRGARKGGHKLIYLPNHPHAKKNFYSFHRFLVEKEIGRILLPIERVHHVDCDQENNEIENFDLLPNNTEHCLAHGSLNKCVAELLKTGTIRYSKQDHRYYTEGINANRRN
jgi:endogenous inhibitor of DNA gyrase (YacG/DUF329 family)